MTTVRVDIDNAGIAALLRSPAVQADLMQRAEAVASTARSGAPTVEGEPGDVSLPISVIDAGSSRARALVSIDHPSGLAVEAKHRLLGSAIDAAR